MEKEMTTILRGIEDLEKIKRRRILRRKILVYVIGSGIMAAGIMISWSSIKAGAQDTEPEPIATVAEPITVPTEPESVFMTAGIGTFLSEVGEDAVPRQNTDTQTLGWDSDEAYLLAKIAMAEAEGEDTIGKALVILTVLNRVQSYKFPDTIEEVIFQDGEFTPIRNGRFDRVEPNEDCYAALDLIEGGWDESQGALYFERTTTKSTWHSRNLKKLFKHGNATFYTEEADAE